MSHPTTEWNDFTIEVERDGATHQLPISWVLAWLKERERDQNTIEDAVQAALDAWLEDRSRSEHTRED